MSTVLYNKISNIITTILRSIYIFTSICFYFITDLICVNLGICYMIIFMVVTHEDMKTSNEDDRPTVSR